VQGREERRAGLVEGRLGWSGRGKARGIGERSRCCNDGGARNEREQGR